MLRILPASTKSSRKPFYDSGTNDFAALPEPLRSAVAKDCPLGRSTPDFDKRPFVTSWDSLKRWIDAPRLSRFVVHELLRALARIVRPGGTINIQAWAMEQDEGSRRKFAAPDFLFPSMHSRNILIRDMY